MERIRTKEQFIEKANQIYQNKYDYSLTEYVKSSEKVKIICPEHGVFEKTPNKHLAGQGCPICGRNRTKTGVDEFIERARKIHGDRYDYSKVIYNRKDQPIEIICPEHGSFFQTPHEHTILKHNCPKCGYAAAGRKRTGDKNVAHRNDVKKAKAETNLRKYGTKTWAESDEGREKLRDIITNEKLDIMKQTCQERYGTDFWTQCDDGKEKLHEIMSSDEMQQKIKDGYDQKYGMHYMQTKEGRERAKEYIDDARREKIQGIMLQRYGATNAFASKKLYKKIREASRLALIKKYGVPYPVLSDEKRKLANEKAWRTKRINCTFNTSQPEKTLYKLLCDCFGEDHVKRQHKEARYPFHCDFYIDSEDLFIELNAHWSHGGHWFDQNNYDDLIKLNKWREKSRIKGSKYYHQAINVWTERDLMKKRCAENSHLNYVVFWKQDLSDARQYLSQYVAHSEAIK